VIKHLLSFLLCCNVFAGQYNENEIVATVLILEAGGEKDDRCMSAIYEVICNRQIKRHLSKIEVCLQKYQFSEFNDGKIKEKIAKAKKHPKYKKALSLISMKTDYTQGATHFYSTNIAKPYWAKKMKETLALGAFKFYKE